MGFRSVKTNLSLINVIWNNSKFGYDFLIIVLL